MGFEASFKIFTNSELNRSGKKLSPRVASRSRVKCSTFPSFSISFFNMESERVRGSPPEIESLNLFFPDLEGVLSKKILAKTEPAISKTAIGSQHHHPVGIAMN